MFRHESQAKWNDIQKFQVNPEVKYEGWGMIPRLLRAVKVKLQKKREDLRPKTS
jgi:hypothetical protein